MARYFDSLKLWALDDDDTALDLTSSGFEGVNTGDLTLLGNDLGNELTGNAGNNTLDGGAGSDTMIGGLGNDTYFVNSTGDVVTEDTLAGAGIDTVFALISFTDDAPLFANVENLTLTGAGELDAVGNALSNTIRGNSAANTLEGRAGNDILDGGAGNDELIGGLGNDTYIVDSSTDVVTEDSVAGSGIDTVLASATFTLSANVENLTLTGAAAINGTGNALANTITGNAAANVLIGAEGDDILDGGLGIDRLDGGIGNDAYRVDNTGDVVIEGANGGTDTVTASANYTLAANVENLIAAQGTVALSLTGNASNNTLTGNAGANRIDGGVGNDTMVGGLGDDVYIVDNALDVVTEAAIGGSDTVQTSVSYTLAATSEVEFLTVANVAAATGLSLTGSETANTLTGDAGANVLNGMGGNDILKGGLGKDVLTGGAGSDIFVFAEPLKAANVDRIIGFESADTIWVENEIFKGLKAGNLSKSSFTFIKKNAELEAKGKADQIIYEHKTGKLYFDQDGTAGKDMVHFATIANKAKLSISDFFVT
ncbi:calcium-binding protein [Microvirga pudoricolor]|uniref:calcium-binding protein n=1 Tax=Microvirga pudoricolor TaxID=2778729 RepID=UPI001950429A|nr:calcium-binding protein [Microvirga pudoricolor]MBM6596219.1 calcium-binding protein [Microvirga pudoricolor]